MQCVVATSEIHTSPSTYTPSGSLSVPGDNEQSPAETSEISINSFSKNSKRNWQLPTSRTEKNLETNREQTVKRGSSTPTPTLLHLCKSEHDKQLQWIRFEINHLSHLKELLEKQEEVTKKLSNLADHEHKFHKIKPVDKLLHNNKLQRSKAKGCDHWSISTVRSTQKDNESSPQNATMKTESSSNLECQESALPDSCNHSQTSESQILQPRKQGRVLKKPVNQHSFSTQTPTLDSYILHNVGSISSDLKGLSVQNQGSNVNKGRLNVYVQTSPKAIKTQEKIQSSVPAFTLASENAKQSYENAVKCCCECRRALEEILHPDHVEKKDEVSQTYCRCRSAGLVNSSSELDQRNKQSVTKVSCSSNSQTDSTAPSCCPESGTSDGIHHPQKCNISTETVTNQGVQTSESVCEVPLIKTLWNRENNKTETASGTNQKEERFCPCCGLCERPGFTKRQHSQNKAGKKVDIKTKHGKVNGWSNPICDASVQTSTKEPFAYLLTFEPTCKENIRTESNNSLPEIKLFVPVSQNNLESEMKKKIYNENVCKENLYSPAHEAEKPYNPIDQNVQMEEGMKQHKLTLQEYLRTNRPDYIQHADKRSQCLADLALLRDLRKQKRLELMSMTDKYEKEKFKEISSNEKIIFSCASVPSKPKFTSRMIREQSRRKFHKTREVQNKLVDKKKKEDFRTNRLMAELFTKKLQKKVLQGVVNYSNCASVISSVP